MIRKAKSLVVFIGIGVFTLYSCKKDGLNPKDAFVEEVAKEEPVLVLSSSRYEKSIEQPLETNGKDYYSKGVIEYKVNNKTEAIFDFGDSDTKVLVTKNGVGKRYDLKKGNEKSKFKKVIVSPMIKTDDCDYIVEGIVKYYDGKSGEYLAMVDFGDGTCDDIAVKSWPAGKSKGKTWAAGSKTFSLKDWYSKKK